MDRPKVGDKVFLYGQYMAAMEDFEDIEYNSLIGYQTVGGYSVELIESDIPTASVPGFITDLDTFEFSQRENWFAACLTVETPFSGEWLEITDKIALQKPMAAGTRIFTPWK